MADRLRALWDFDDLDTSERRLREQLAREADDAGDAEVLTQLARVEGLRGDVERRRAADRGGGGASGRRRDRARSHRPGASDAFAAPAGTQRRRCRCSRRRSRRRSKPARPSSPRTRRTWPPSPPPTARASSPGPNAGSSSRRPTTTPGTGSARSSTTSAGSATSTASTRRRWTRSSGRCVLANGTRPTARRSRSRATPSASRCARSAARRKPSPFLEQAVAWAQREGAPDGWFHEELAEEYAALGRANEAREQARLAVPLLAEADPSFAEDGDRGARLRSLAAD